MALRKYQFQIKPNRLYIVKKMDTVVANEQIQPNIMVNGCVDI